MCFRHCFVEILLFGESFGGTGAEVTITIGLQTYLLLCESCWAVLVNGADTKDPDGAFRGFGFVTFQDRATADFLVELSAQSRGHMLRTMQQHGQTMYEGKAIHCKRAQKFERVSRAELEAELEEERCSWHTLHAQVFPFCFMLCVCVCACCWLWFCEVVGIFRRCEMLCSDLSANRMYRKWT
ncbi:unnamed protein product [Polarella glacialis]|uniref:RRM domain-containing protein n=1 Tax=Polarella glacialis TaxID=89957 RepID=A0A813DVT4_POLGL|nr:unnamed protein product [Polarella glacialis]